MLNYSSAKAGQLQSFDLPGLTPGRARHRVSEVFSKTCHMRKEQQSPAHEPEKFERWPAQRKVATILEVLKGKISVRERLVGKGLDGEHRAEVRRLQRRSTS